MPSWGWILVGAILLGSELFIDAEFYLTFLGVAALLVGLAGLAGLEGAIWEEFLAYGILSVGLLFTFRSQLYSRFARGRGVERPLLDERATAQERIEPAGRGRVELRGSTWTAENVGDQPIEAGAAVRVEQVDGLTVRVRAEHEVR